MRRYVIKRRMAEAAFLLFCLFNLVMSGAGD